jgi:hypothetical protein
MAKASRPAESDATKCSRVLRLLPTDYTDRMFGMARFSRSGIGMVLQRCSAMMVVGPSPVVRRVRLWGGVGLRGGRSVAFVGPFRPSVILRTIPPVIRSLRSLIPEYKSVVGNPPCSGPRW